MSRQVDGYTVYKDAQPVHLRFHSHGTDARTVRPYTASPTILQIWAQNKQAEAGEVYSYFRQDVVLL